MIFGGIHLLFILTIFLGMLTGNVQGKFSAWRKLRPSIITEHGWTRYNTEFQFSFLRQGNIHDSVKCFYF